MKTAPPTIDDDLLRFNHQSVHNIRGKIVMTADRVKPCLTLAPNFGNLTEFVLLLVELDKTVTMIKSIDLKKLVGNGVNKGTMCPILSMAFEIESGNPAADPY